ncbi:hypothetical protein L3X38_031115 [Prunus dulcis]|uniref:Integral membrane bound transporter domain-containing protein n=1 Tax=Prunus dulcis TaxID=3755 RepID=A0AAD4YVA7_PRUDU|nr:hypothetical protein L3X38_031115 [Prunus dulcis]
MATSPYQTNRAQALWLTCLASAFRTCLACTIVALTTLYGPQALQHQVAFPAFSYVTVILIAPDATLGNTLCGLWLGLYATAQTIGPAMLSLWLIGPARLSSGITALAVGLAAFVVALPEFTHLVCRRIALGQIVIVYVIAYIKGGEIQAIMHPVHVAASTGIGVLACVLAFLVPFPRLASREVKQNAKLLGENASERLKLFVKAFCAEDNTSALASISQAKSLAATATKLFQTIKRHQESMEWEKLPLKFSRYKYANPGDRLQGFEIPLKGMEMALTSTPSFPIKVVNGEHKDGLLRVNLSAPCDSTTVPESNAENVRFLQTLKTIPQTQQDLPPIFFLFCIKLFHGKLSATSPTEQGKLLVHQNEGAIDSRKQNGFCFKEVLSNLSIKVRSKRLMIAFKCSLSLGLAVFFGLVYSKKNGFWSGLPVAISFASAREAAFKVANVKAQGTVLGTVYGVLGCFLFQRFLSIRLLSLIPWFIFTSFLQRSRMYGQAGGISAVIGAVLILGRANFGPPSEFAIARITETFIGLSCSIMVDLLLQPTRASTLAKAQLSRTLDTLQECINSVSLQSGRALLEENQKRLKNHVEELGKLIGEAEAEPNFWFWPFHSACYGKLLRSLSKMMDLLLFSAHAVEVLEQNSQMLEASWKDMVHTVECDLELFKKMVGSFIECFKEITLIKSITVHDQKSEIAHDLELGKSGNPTIFRICGSKDEEMDTIISSYLQHSKEVVDKIHVQSEELKSQMVLCLSSLGFCISSIIRATKEIEEEIKELAQWENPSSHINLYEISCKMHALQK